MVARFPARLGLLLDADPEAVRLAEVALLVATGVRPDLDIDAQFALLDDMADVVRSRLPDQHDEQAVVLALNAYLFEDLGFEGAHDDYQDPRNSYLDEVISRHRGIPITLSILYIDIGRQLGLDLEGVAFPGHFLVRCDMADGVVIIDPYGGGITLDRDDLQARLRESRIGEVSDEALDEMLEPASPRDIAARMLRNLKAVHLEAKRFEPALDALEWLVSVLPDDDAELRDRGRIYDRLDCFRPALADYVAYLERSPEADDADSIRGRIVDLQRSAARLN